MDRTAFLNGSNQRIHVTLQSVTSPHGATRTQIYNSPYTIPRSSKCLQCDEALEFMTQLPPFCDCTPQRPPIGGHCHHSCIRVIQQLLPSITVTQWPADSANGTKGTHLLIVSLQNSYRSVRCQTRM